MNWEEANKEYSKWALLHKIYAAKNKYYTTGKNSLTDYEYDAIEKSYKAIHGELGEYSCVGYDKVKHQKIKRELNKYKILSVKAFYVRQKKETERRKLILDSLEDL